MTDSGHLAPPPCAGPQLAVRRPKLALPPKAADCHCHVFGPRDKYPWAANRVYTPPPVYLDDYLAMHRATGLERGVLVQTALYGNDNSFIVDAIKANPGRLRGIALIGEDVTDRALRELAEAGVRGGGIFSRALRAAARPDDLRVRAHERHVAPALLLQAGAGVEHPTKAQTAPRVAHTVKTRTGMTAKGKQGRGQRGTPWGGEFTAAAIVSSGAVRRHP